VNTDSRALARRDFWLVLLLVVVVGRLFWLDLRATSAGVDFYQFWLVGQAQQRVTIEDIYAPEGRRVLLEAGRSVLSAQPDSARLGGAVEFRQSIETFSTPLLYMAVDSLARGDYDVDLARFHLLSFVCFVLGVGLLSRLCRMSWTTTGLILLVLFACSEPLRSDARVGNVNQIQLAGIALYLWLLRGSSSALRQGLAGAFVGVLTLFKPTLGLGFGFLALGWLLRREWRRLAIECVGFSIAAVAAIAASSAFLGSRRAWLDWLAALPALSRDADVSVAIGNFSLARVVTEQGGPDVSAPLLLVLVLATACALWLGARRAPRERSEARAFERELLTFVLGCASCVVALPLVWLHYEILLVPLAVFLLRSRGASSAPGLVERIALALASVCVLGRPIAAFAPSAEPYTAALPYIAGALVLVALGLLDLFRLGRREPGSLSPSSY